MTYTFSTTSRIVSKKDGQVIARSRSGKPFIVPNADARACETLLALKFRKAVPKKLGKARVSLTVRYRGKGDLDNACSTIMDALETSGRLDNDGQVDELHVYRTQRETGGCDVEVEVLRC